VGWVLADEIGLVGFMELFIAEPRRLSCVEDVAGEILP
jgi:hypothetical protein